MTLEIDNKDKLMRPQKAGKELAIKCDVDLVNVRKLLHNQLFQTKIQSVTQLDPDEEIILKFCVIK